MSKHPKQKALKQTGLTVIWSNFRGPHARGVVVEGDVPLLVGSLAVNVPAVVHHDAPLC